MGGLLCSVISQKFVLVPGSPRRRLLHACGVSFETEARTGGEGRLGRSLCAALPLSQPLGDESGSELTISPKCQLRVSHWEQGSPTFL